ncbi:MAG: hypothetical protein ACTS6A_01345 [Candidatus Hodgkinia cicadicola]
MPVLFRNERFASQAKRLPTSAVLRPKTFEAFRLLTIESQVNDRSSPPPLNRRRNLRRTC